MRILILGAGYVGLALLKELQKFSFELFVTTTDESRVSELKNLANHIIVIKPNDNEPLKAAINICDAMIVLVAPKNFASYEDTYLQTAMHISCILKNRIKPFYLLYTSSTSVCESSLPEWVTEERALSPASQNAKILLETEATYLNISKAETCVLRLGGIYGPGRDLINRAKRISGQILPGSGNEPTNHIHQEDIVAAILFFLKNRLTGLYHLVNDDHTPKKELYTKLCESAKLPPPTFDNLVQRPAKSYKVSNEKIKNAGFTFTHSTLF